MPIYEYECTRCGQLQEVLQKLSDKPLTKCKRCSGKMHRLVSQSSFHLKGSGWYVTDYAKKSKNLTTPTKSGADPKPSSPEKKTTAGDGS